MSRRHHYSPEGQMRLGLPVRSPVLRLHTSDDLIVDNFAGGGGASLGIKWALGRDPDIAVNHSPEAIAMHRANHPSTHHYCGDVWDVNPAEVCAGKRVALAWFSPDCTFFSKARGKKPVSKKSRALAWVVVRWARAVKPRVIVLENVEEFEDWGPLNADNLPDPKRRGLTFRIWLGKLKAAGYDVDLRQLRACDYGAPTTRKRLFIIARCDGQPIVWPEPTHGPGLEPYRSAAECIDWTVPTVSIFASREEGRACGVQRPLRPNTMARIGRGVWKYVIGAAKRVGQAPRCMDIQKPLSTIVAGGVKHGLVSAYLAKHYGDPNRKIFGTCKDGQPLTEPMPTIRAQGTHLGEVRAFLVKYYGTGTGQTLVDPMATITTRDRFGLVTVEGVDYAIVDIGMRMLIPRELFSGNGFPTDYIIDPEYQGEPLSKTAQVKMVGNSVSPYVAEALVRANVGSAKRAVA